MAKDNTDKNDDLALQLKQIQDQIHELLLESRIAKQDKEDQASRLATIE